MHAAQLSDYDDANTSVKRGDRWWQAIGLDPNEDWSGSTFTPSSNVDAPYAVAVDDANKAASPPYIILSLAAAGTAAHSKQAFQFDLAEDVVIGYTFLEGLIAIEERFAIVEPEIP